MQEAHPDRLYGACPNLHAAASLPVSVIQRMGWFQVARHPSRVDAKRGDHFLQADLNEAARAADASREATGAVYGERLK